MSQLLAQSASDCPFLLPVLWLLLLITNLELDAARSLMTILQMVLKESASQSERESFLPCQLEHDLDSHMASEENSVQTMA